MRSRFCSKTKWISLLCSEVYHQTNKPGMSGNWDDYLAGDRTTKYNREDASKWKINTLLTELLEKDEEITMYKKRLKELETAFYYNLQLIGERDLELSVLEKHLGSENDQIQDIVRERNELESLLRLLDNKNSKKIKQLETKLALKGEEIREIQRENTAQVNTLKKLLEDAKHRQEKMLLKISSKFEIQKKELIKGYQEEMEEKEKYYLLEIDNLAGKLAQACLEKDDLLKAAEENKNELDDVKRLFLEKENKYLEEIRKRCREPPSTRNREVQCDIKPQVFEKRTQTKPELTTVDSQTVQQDSEREDEYIQKINFLLEQNEVLKYIVKDLKRNRDLGGKPGEPTQPPGCECCQIRTEIEQVNQKFECEISNLKKLLEEEHKSRTEEDALIQSLETSVTFLKEKLLSGLQEKIHDFQGEDICTYTYSREIQNEIQVTLLERKLSQKIDSFVAATQEESRIVHKKLEEIKKECVDKMEKYMKPNSELGSEALLQRIRIEIQKLEDKIENDMKNLVRNNFERNNYERNNYERNNYERNNLERNKCEKDFSESKRVSPRVSCSGFPEDQPPRKNRWGNEVDGSVGLYYRNDLSEEKSVTVIKSSRPSNGSNQSRKRVGELRGFRRVPNNLVLGR